MSSTDLAGGYLRIGELARRTGVSPELLRAWEQRYGLLRPSRSAGGFRLYSEVDEARVRRMRELIAQGLSAAEASRRALGSDVVTSEPPTPLADDLAAELESALEALDGQKAHRTFDRLLAGFSIEMVIQEVLLPYFRRLGERWATGEVSVAQEHFASNLIRGRLLGLARDWGAGGGPSIVLACPPGEAHELGLIMFGIVVALRGWRVTYLGADTPFATLEETVRSLEPALVVLSVSNGLLFDPHAGDLERMTAEVPVAVAGALTPERAADLGVRLLEGDPVEAARAVALSLPRRR